MGTYYNDTPTEMERYDRKGGKYERNGVRHDRKGVEVQDNDYR